MKNRPSGRPTVQWQKVKNPQAKKTDSPRRGREETVLPRQDPPAQAPAFVSCIANAGGPGARRWKGWQRRIGWVDHFDQSVSFYFWVFRKKFRKYR